MPPTLKSLATVSVWVLFIGGCVAIAVGIVERTDSRLVGSGFLGVMLSVVATWFRKKLD